MNVSVIVSYFGDRTFWAPLAERALASAECQTARDQIQVIESYADELCRARNNGANRADGEWLIFLDADDELDPKYVEAMLAGDGDLRQPSTLGVVDGKEDPAPYLIPAKPLLDGNYIVIGAMVRHELFDAVGGFRDLPAYEDWDLWIRCWLNDAQITSCPEAVYRVHVRPGSRNQLSREMAVQLYNEIRNQYLPLAMQRGRR